MSIQKNNEKSITSINCKIKMENMIYNNIQAYQTKKGHINVPFCDSK